MCSETVVQMRNVLRAVSSIQLYCTIPYILFYFVLTVKNVSCVLETKNDVTDLNIVVKVVMFHK